VRPDVSPGGPRIVVFAYHDIGVACLEVLLRCRADLAAVVTHEDDPGERVWFGSVAALAGRHGIPVHVPENPNCPDSVATLRAYQPDLICSFYYRHLLSREVLALPRVGAINLHGSLLPKYRGRAPINWVLVHGETETGVTLHYMDERADHGDIIMQEAVPITIEDTALTLSRKLAKAAPRLLEAAYPLLVAGKAPRISQDHAAATTFGRRRPADGRIDWSRSGWQIYNLIRAVTHPFPGAFTYLHDRQVFIWSARPPDGRATSHPPGHILGVGEGGSLEVAAGNEVLELLRLQVAGEAEMDGAELITATLADTSGATFGDAERRTA
jgi:methionyl-tRNA formyltransferase